MKKTIYLLLGLCLAFAVFLPHTATEVKAEDGVLGDLTGDSAVTTDDKTAFENYLLGIDNETTTANITYANVNGIEDESEGAVTDVRDLVRYERYLYLKDAAENATDENYSLSGSGTSAAPYLINNVKDLYCFATKSIGDGVYYYYDGTSSSKRTHLTSNLELNVGTGDPSTWDDAEQLLYSWIPVGTKIVQFSETIDGCYNDKNHTISGLYCDRSGDYTGLVGYSNNANALIQNLAIKNSCFKGGKYVGGFAGTTAGNCINLYCDAYIHATGAYAGGIVGAMGGANAKMLKNCWFAGTIESASSQVGGIVGIVTHTASTSNLKSIISCLYTGEIIVTNTARTPLVGGIVADVDTNINSFAIQDCLAIGDISTVGDQGVAAIAGRIRSSTISLKVEDIYSACTMTCTGYSSWNNNTNVTGIGQVFNTTAGSGWVKGSAYDGITVWAGNESYLNGYGGYRLTELPFVNGVTEYDDENNNGTTKSAAVWSAVNNAHPILQAWKEVSEFSDNKDYPTLTLDSTMTAKASIDWYVNNPNTNASLYTLADEEDLWGFGFLANTYDIDFQGKTIELSQTITLTSGEKWTPLYQDVKGTDVGFKGKFDGNGNSISGLSIESNVTGVGFFAEMKHGSEVYDFKLVNCSVTSIDDAEYVGSIAGMCGGDIYNVYSDADIVSSGAYCGGITGILSGGATHKIEQAWFDGTIETDGTYCGGIVGRITMGADTAAKNLTNCINSGTIISTQTKSDINYLGGLCGGVHATKGNALDAIFTDCLNIGTIQTSITSGVGSVVGYVENEVNGNKNTTLTLTRVYTTDVVKGLDDGSYTQLEDEALDALYNSPVWGIGKGGNGTINDGYVLGRIADDETLESFVQQIPTTDFTWSVTDDDSDGIYTVTYSAVEATE